MAALSRSDIHPFIRKVENIALFALSETEKAALAALPMQVAVFEAGQDIVREFDRPTRSFAILDGVACMYKTTQAGKRQILSYQIPGDVPDLQSLHLEVLDNSIATISRCRIGFVQHEALRTLFHDHPRLTGVFWRSTLTDAAILRAWMLNIGRRAAYARLAHLLCEMFTRMRVVGLVDDQGCALPMTQTELGDALGITTVHVNRTLKELRGTGLITLQGGRLTVLDWARLKAAGEFDATYLHVQAGEAG